MPAYSILGAPIDRDHGNLEFTDIIRMSRATPLYAQQIVRAYEVYKQEATENGLNKLLITRVACVRKVNVKLTK